MPGGPEMPAFDQEFLKPKYRFGLPGRAKIIVILVGGLLFTVGLGVSVFWRGLWMTLSEPTLDADGKQIRATFRLENSVFGYRGNGMGGACLIADIAGLVTPEVATEKGIFKGTCTTEAQCNIGNPQKWHGYCLADERNVRRCWYKPVIHPDPDPKKIDSELCNKSPFNPNPIWALGVDHNVPFRNGFDVPAFYAAYTNGQPAKWRLAGLLRGTQPGTLSTSYGDPVCLTTGAPCSN